MGKKKPSKGAPVKKESTQDRAKRQALEKKQEKAEEARKAEIMRNLRIAQAERAREAPLLASERKFQDVYDFIMNKEIPADLMDRTREQIGDNPYLQPLLRHTELLDDTHLRLGNATIDGSDGGFFEFDGGEIHTERKTQGVVETYLREHVFNDNEKEKFHKKPDNWITQFANRLRGENDIGTGELDSTNAIYDLNHLMNATNEVGSEGNRLLFPDRTLRELGREQNIERDQTHFSLGGYAARAMSMLNVRDAINAPRDGGGRGAAYPSIRERIEAVKERRRKGEPVSRENIMERRKYLTALNAYRVNISLKDSLGEGNFDDAVREFERRSAERDAAEEAAEEAEKQKRIEARQELLDYTNIMKEKEEAEVTALRTKSFFSEIEGGIKSFSDKEIKREKKLDRELQRLEDIRTEAEEEERFNLLFDEIVKEDLTVAKGEELQRLEDIRTESAETAERKRIKNEQDRQAIEDARSYGDIGTLKSEIGDPERLKRALKALENIKRTEETRAVGGSAGEATRSALEETRSQRQIEAANRKDAADIASRLREQDLKQKKLPPAVSSAEKKAQIKDTQERIKERKEDINRLYRLHTGLGEDFNSDNVKNRREKFINRPNTLTPNERTHVGNDLSFYLQNRNSFIMGGKELNNSYEELFKSIGASATQLSGKYGLQITEQPEDARYRFPEGERGAAADEVSRDLVSDYIGGRALEGQLSQVETFKGGIVGRGVEQYAKATDKSVRTDYTDVGQPQQQRQAALLFPKQGGQQTHANMVVRGIQEAGGGQVGKDSKARGLYGNRGVLGGTMIESLGGRPSTVFHQGVPERDATGKVLNERIYSYADPALGTAGLGGVDFGRAITLGQRTDATGAVRNSFAATLAATGLYGVGGAVSPQGVPIPTEGGEREAQPQIKRSRIGTAVGKGSPETFRKATLRQEPRRPEDVRVVRRGGAGGAGGGYSAIRSDYNVNYQLT